MISNRRNAPISWIYAESICGDDPELRILDPHRCIAAHTLTHQQHIILRPLQVHILATLAATMRDFNFEYGDDPGG